MNNSNRKMFHIAVLSVGSLLGQNILDLSEGRRKNIRITGLNTNCDNPRVFRCDKAIKSPPANSDHFEDFILSVISGEKPDLVLAGRDLDTVFLSKLVEKYPELNSIIPAGSSYAAEIMNDKALSYQFAIDNDLPFADTRIMKNENYQSIKDWCERKGYPVFAKPTEGFGSLGCKFIMDESQLTELFRNHKADYILQEVLDFNEDKKNYIKTFNHEIKSGIPVFTQLPDHFQYAGQTCIFPDGTFDRIFTSVSLMILGRCERAERFEDIRFTGIVRKFAVAISEAGWRGMFNIQCKKNHGEFIPHEMNGRMSGSTSARRWMGYDELRILIQSFKGIDIGQDERDILHEDGFVYRSLTDYFIPYNAIHDFEGKGFWTKTT
jgi:carbamoyl-phosphate synthase large subunit